MKKIDLIENIYVQEFNKDYILLKIKYLGKVKKMINIRSFAYHKTLSIFKPVFN